MNKLMLISVLCFSLINTINVNSCPESSNDAEEEDLAFEIQQFIQEKQDKINKLTANTREEFLNSSAKIIKSIPTFNTIFHKNGNADRLSWLAKKLINKCIVKIQRLNQPNEGNSLMLNNQKIILLAIKETKNDEFSCCIIL